MTMSAAGKRRVPVLILATVGFVSVVQACNVTVFNHCFRFQVTDLHERFQNESVFPVYDNTTLSHICSQIVSVNSTHCVDSVRSECLNPFEISLFDSSMAVSEYMCTAGSNGYVKHRHCFSQPKVVNNGTLCVKTYETQLLGVQRKQYICRSLDELVECVRKAVDINCGTEAAQWILRAKTISLHPIKQFMKCGAVPGGLGDEDEMIGLAILFSCGLLTLIILAVSLCVCRFRQNRRQASTTTRVAKNGAETGDRVAAEAVLTNSSDLHCCGHVTSIIRDDHKQRAHNGNSICLSNIGQ